MANTTVNDDLELNLGDIQTGFSAIPSGTYAATIFGVPELKRSNPDGNPYLELQVKLRGGEFNGRQLRSRMSLLPQSLWKVKQTLDRLGFKDLANSKTLKVGELRQALAGQDCRVTITTRTYWRDGDPQDDEHKQTTNDVMEILAVGGDTPKSGSSKKDLF